MKRLSILPIILLLVCFYTVDLHAQDPTTADANVTVSANVFTALTVTVNNNVDFGQIETNGVYSPELLEIIRMPISYPEVR